MPDEFLQVPFVTGDGCLVRENCRHYSAQCWACTWPEDALRPIYYLPRDPQIEHPQTTVLKAQRAARRKMAKQSVASKRGRASRRKGQRVEREFAKLTGGARVPLSGALRGNLSNDVALPPDLGSLKVEVKYRTSGLSTLYKWMLDDVEKPDAVVVKAPNQPFLVIQTYDQWAAGRAVADIDFRALQEAYRYLKKALGEEKS